MSDLFSVTLSGPAKIGGRRYLPGARIDASAEVLQHLREAGAVPPPRDWTAVVNTAVKLHEFLTELSAGSAGKDPAPPAADTHTEGAEDLPEPQGDRDEAPVTEPPSEPAAPAGEAEASPVPYLAEGTPKTAPSDDGPVRKTGRSKTKG